MQINKQEEEAVRLAGVNVETTLIVVCCSDCLQQDRVLAVS